MMLNLFSIMVNLVFNEVGGTAMDVYDTAISIIDF